MPHGETRKQRTILMRIIAGTNKGGRIRVAKKGTRPTKGLVREAIFDVLGAKVIDAAILDVFAGSGALGIEALSRGARSCFFIEKQPKELFRNIQSLSFMEKTRVIIGDFRFGLKKLKGTRFSLIFLDPPYGKGYLRMAINLIGEYGLIEDNGIIIAEHAVEDTIELPKMFSVQKIKRYGDTAVSFVTTNPTLEAEG